MYKRYFYLLAFIFGLLLVACRSEPETSTEPTIPLEACRLNGGIEAQCGVYTVFEDRAAGNGRTIDLNIAVIPATDNNVQPDPIFLLAGGPGQAATEAFPVLIPILDDLNEARDIVLVDQRGTGQSNPLHCAALDDDELNFDISDEEVVAILQACAADFDADLTLYSTDVAMADLNDVRAALGYEQINLIGISYGTRAALTYMRLYPEQVRSVVLDAVTSPEQVLFLQMPRDGQRALDMLFARCAADAACQENFPDLEAELDALLAAFAEPRTVTIVNPVSGEPETIRVTSEVIMQSIFNSLYVVDFVSLLPLLIHHAHATEDVTPLLTQLLILAEQAGLYNGMLYSVTCAEDAPLITLEEAEAIQSETDFPLMAEQFLQICAEWPRAEVTADFREPIVSDIPVLLLSGAADPVTPPYYAAEVAETLSNSRHLTAPGYGHGILVVGCVPDIVTNFVTTAAVDTLDTGCLDNLQPPPFFVNFSGPSP